MKPTPVTKKSAKCVAICGQCGKGFCYLKACIKHEAECGKADEEERKLLSKSKVGKV